MLLSIQVLVALIVGAFYYMVAVVLTVYDGIGSFIFQPVMGLICSFIIIIPCLIVGLPIRFYEKLHCLWKRYWWFPFVLGTIGFLLMYLANFSYYQVLVYDSLLEQEVVSLNPTLYVSGWVLTIFAVLHFYPPWARKT